MNLKANERIEPHDVYVNRISSSRYMDSVIAFIMIW